jgi:DNA-binding NarL/FixJ family response regulator
MTSLGPAAEPRTPIRLLLADDHVVFRAGLRALLQLQQDLVVVGEAGRGEEAVATARATRPDVVLMDLAMPGKGGLEATRRIIALGIEARVLVLTALPQERELLDALDAGATGFVEKTEAAEHLVRGIRTVAAGGLFLGAEAAKFVVLQRYQRQGQVEDEKVAADRLSRSERQMLALLALGRSPREIGRELALKPYVVADYRARLMDRLGLAHRSELVEFALHTGLIGAE